MPLDKFKPILFYLAMGVIVIVVSIVGGRFLTSLEEEIPLPEGFTIIRPPEEVNAMILDGDFVWAGGRDGVYQIDRLNKELIQQLDLPEYVDLVKGLVVDWHGNLWIGHFGGLTIYDGIQYHHLGPHQLPDQRVNCIYKTREGHILVGTFGGVAVFDGTEVTFITQESGLLDSMVNVIYEDHLGGLWFGHYVAPLGGVSYLSQDEWQYFTIDNQLPHNNVTVFYQDTSHDLWIGTGLFHTGGAARLSLNHHTWQIVQTYSMENDVLAGEKVRSIFQDHMDHLWIGSEFDGLAIVLDLKIPFNTDNLIYLDEEHGLSGYEVKVMWQDQNQNLWLGTHNGVTVINADGIKQYIKSTRKDD